MAKKTAEKLSVNNGLSWEWRVANMFGGLSAEKTIYMQSMVRRSLAVVRDLRGEAVSKNMEALLPISLEYYSSLMRELSTSIRKISPRDLANEVKKARMPDGRSIADLGLSEEKLAGYLEDFMKAVGNGVGLVSTVDGRDGVGDTDLSVRVSGLLNRLNLSNSLQPVTSEGVFVPKSTNEWESTYDAQMGRGLITSLARDKVVPFVAAAAGCYLFARLGIESSIEGAGKNVDRGVATMLALGVFCVESWALPQVVKVLKSEHLQMLTNDIISWIVVFGLALVVAGAYVYDITTTYAGLGMRGVENELIRVVGTAGASILPEVLLSFVIAESLETVQGLFSRRPR